MVPQQMDALTQAAGPVAPTTHAEGTDMDKLVPPAAEPIDVSTLHAAISEFSSGFSTADLARLEDHLVKHFQVSPPLAIWLYSPGKLLSAPENLIC